MLEQCLNFTNILLIAYATIYLNLNNAFFILIFFIGINELKLFKIEGFAVCQAGKNIF